MYFPENRNLNKPSNYLINSIEKFAKKSFAEDFEIQIYISLMREIEEQLSQNGTLNNHLKEVILKCYSVLYANKEILSLASAVEVSNKLQVVKNELLYIIDYYCSFRRNICCGIENTIKPYKGLYIFLLSRPDNNSSVVAEILSSVNFLDKMTREVTFIMPGYRRAQGSEDVYNEPDKNMQLTFDENVFIDIVQELENKSNGKYQYLDDCELLLIGKDSHKNYDFDNYAQLDLNYLKLNQNIDVVKLIIAASHYFRNRYDSQTQMRVHAKQIINSLKSNNNFTKRVFIAGSKKLNEERALIREELSKVANVKDLDMRSLTFEDFATSLTGKNRGRQANYNKFIEEDANIVVFVFDNTVGEITEEEFDIAYNSLKDNKHPDIFVYVRRRNLFVNLFMNRKLRNIKNKVFNYHQEYYVEYANLDDLRYKFYRDMLTYIEK